MLVLAIGTFTDPSKIGPYAEAETATIHAHMAAGIVTRAYQRVDGKGVALVWRVGNLAEARERIGQLLLAARSDDGGAHGDRGVLITLAVVGAGPKGVAIAGARALEALEAAARYDLAIVGLAPPLALAVH